MLLLLFCLCVDLHLAHTAVPFSLLCFCRILALVCVVRPYIIMHSKLTRSRAFNNVCLPFSQPSLLVLLFTCFILLLDLCWLSGAYKASCAASASWPPSLCACASATCCCCCCCVCARSDRDSFRRLITISVRRRERQVNQVLGLCVLLGAVVNRDRQRLRNRAGSIGKGIHHSVILLIQVRGLIVPFLSEPRCEV